MSTSSLQAALQVKTPTLVYQVEALADVMGALGPAARIDARGEPERSALEAQLARLKGGETVVVLLGLEVCDAVRAALSDREGVKVIGVTPAAAPTAQMRALFPLQLAARRVLEGRAA